MRQTAALGQIAQAGADETGEIIPTGTISREVMQLLLYETGFTGGASKDPLLAHSGLLNRLSGYALSFLLR